MEGGDDIGVAGPGVEKVAGASGYDWEIGLSDPQPQDADLALPIAPLGILQVGVRDRFNEVESLSGGNLNDTLHGDSIVPAALGGAGFIGCDVLDQAGLDRIAGLDALVPPLNTPADTVIAASVSKCPLLTAGTNVWGDGNILLGGGGSDVMEGRGANDIIDGDKYLSVRLSVRTNAADPATEIGSASIENPGQSAMASKYLRDGAGILTGPTLQQAVFAGTVDPGNIVAVREILTGTGGTDTAVFSGLQAGYTVTTVNETTGTAAVLGSAGSVTTVVDNVGADGTDTVRNVEVLQFADTATPGAPTAVTAVGGIGTATVTWVAPLLNRVAQVVTGFTVEASNVTTGVVRTFPAAAGATTLTMTGLAVGSYTFRVQASNAAATPQAGPFSLPTSAVAVTDLAPAAPTIGAATAGNATATVNWTAPAPNGGSAITGYSVEVTAAGVVTAPLLTAVAGSTSLVVPGLTNGVAYRFRVAAVNAAGTGAFSALSNVVTPSTGVVLTVPGAPSIGTATAGDTTATATWTPPASDGGSAITGYTVRVIDTATGLQVGALRPAGPTATNLVVTGLTNGTTYRFRVRAVNAVGSSVLSAASNAVTPAAGVAVGTAPGAPIIRNAVSGVAGGPITAIANWRPGTNGSSATTGYRVTAIPAAGGASIISAVLTPGPVRDQVFEMTLPAGNYRFTVVAINATGPSPASGQSNLVTAR